MTMHNIMIFGFEWSMYEEKLKPCINRVMRDLKLEKDAITTFFTSPGCITESCDGTAQKKPFILVCSYDYETIRLIIDALADNDIGVDCEPHLLGSEPLRFIPAKEMHRK